MAQDVDKVYTAMRGRILSGELLPGTIIAPNEIEQAFGVTDKKVRQVLNSLVGDYYLVRVQGTYSVISLSHDELEEWQQILSAVFELGAARLILHGDPGQLRPAFAKVSTAGPSDDEEFYLLTMEVYGALLGGQGAKLTAFANQLVPPMFFRLLWLAGIESGGCAALHDLTAAITKAAGAERKVQLVRQACRNYFDGLSEALHRQLDQRRGGLSLDLGKAERTVERRITGHVNYITTPSAPKQLLPRLTSDPVASIKCFLPD